MEIKNTSNTEVIIEERNIDIDIEYSLNQYMDELKVMIGEYSNSLFGSELKT